MTNMVLAKLDATLPEVGEVAHQAEQKMLALKL
jgi:hypothetical protein